MSNKSPTDINISVHIWIPNTVKDSQGHRAAIWSFLYFLLLSSLVQEPEEKDDDEKDQDKTNRTARVQPTPQTREGTVDSPNNPNADRRK